MDFFNFCKNLFYEIIVMNQNFFSLQPNVTSIQGLIQSSLIQCVFNIPIDGTVNNFLSNVNVTNFKLSNKFNVFLDILKGSTSGEFVFNTLQVVIGYVDNAERNTFHKKICNTNTVRSKCLRHWKSGIVVYLYPICNITVRFC